MIAAEQLAKQTNVAVACRSIGITRSSLYRRRQRLRPQIAHPRQPVPRRLAEAERAIVLETLHSPRFVDKSPGEVFATLLDEGVYHCSERTMYRILEDSKEVRERRNQRRHPEYKKPELLAVRPNEVWSWDITKLKGPAKWNYFHLYVILDIFSRYVVGWMIADRESSAHAKRLIQTCCENQSIARDELTLHADRGASMKSKVVGQLLADLGVTKTHSRPHVSNDNPYSESQFKTLKYRPEFPNRFGSIQDAKAFGRPFFDWYNNEHRHSGIAMLTPACVHYGLADETLNARHKIMIAAQEQHPERFVGGPPKLVIAPQAAWINPPTDLESSSVSAH